MKTSPSGFQIAFLIFALAFAAMLVTGPVGRWIDLPNEHFNTLGNLISFPLELGLVFVIPALRQLVLDGLRPPLPPRVRLEAVSLSGLKLIMTFGLWGAVALWGIHVTQRSTDLNAYGFLMDPAPMEQRYFTPWGLAKALFAISLGPVAEEIIYRGVLYRLWERQWGWVVGALLSAIVFSIIHPHNLIQTFLSAILYACLYRRTGTLWAPILCHAFYNLLVTWPLFGHVLMLRPAEAATSFDPWIPHLTCLAVGMVGFVFYVGLTARTSPKH